MPELKDLGPRSLRTLSMVCTHRLTLLVLHRCCWVLLLSLSLTPVGGSAAPLGAPSLVVKDEYVITRTSLPAISSANAASFINQGWTEIVHVPEAAALSNAHPDSGSSIGSEGAGRTFSPYHTDGDRCPSLKQKDPTIGLCSPNYVRVSFADPNPITPNDDRFGFQWPLLSDASAGAINGTRAWAYSNGTSSAVVAVIDGGVNYLHPDLRDSMWVNPYEIEGNGIDDDLNGYIDDIHGADVALHTGDPYSSDSHGSHVAGIIGARGGNGIGVSGVNWRASLIAVKATGSSGYFTTSDLVRAMDYLVNLKVQRGVPIVAANASLGGFNSSEVEYEAIKRLLKAGIILVAASGNETINIDSAPIFPASYKLPNIISVMASDYDGNRASFSNYGLVGADLAAPGVNILSTVGGDRYEFMDGTSMATPFVTGAISLLASYKPELSWQELRAQIFDSGRPLPELERFTSTGRLLDLERLMASAKGVSSFRNGATTSHLFRNIPYKLNIETPAGRNIKRIRYGAPFYIRASHPEPLTGQGTASSYIDLAVNGVSCRRPVKVHGVIENSYTVSAIAPSLRSVSRVRISILNGEGELSSHRILALRGASRAATKRSRKDVNRACGEAISSLAFIS